MADRIPARAGDFVISAWPKFGLRSLALHVDIHFARRVLANHRDMLSLRTVSMRQLG